MATKLEKLIQRYRELGIDQQLDYEKFYIYSLITHSTAIEGSTITEIENQIMFDQGVTIKGKSLEEQMMNLDLKRAYEKSIHYAKEHNDISIAMLKDLSAIVMQNTGTEYNTVLGSFSSAKGDLRLLNVTAGVGGKSYMSYNKVPDRLKLYCEKLNKNRQEASKMSIQQLYDLSFEAHYDLVTIHPWADGNGRVSRLLMNQLQFEFGLIPSKILKEDKEDYIKALVATRESEDIEIFISFMNDIMIKNISKEIDLFLLSTEENKKGKKQGKSREKIMELLREDSSLTSKSLAVMMGKSQKTIEKHILNLRAEGLLVRIGPDKGGHWKVIDGKS